MALGELRVGAVVPRAARDHPRAQRALEHGHVEALDGCDPLDALVDQVGQAAEALGPPGDAERGPGGEGGGRRLDGEPDLALAAACNFGEHLLVDRRAVLEAVVARHALPADEVVGRDLDARNDRAHGANTVALGSTTVLPPSMAMTAPVVNPASSEASQATAAAISSGRPGRRSGTGDATSS